MKEFSESVFLIRTESNYPRIPPYHPDQLYPEYPWKNVAGAICDTESNFAYQAVRELFRICKFDVKNFGKDTWNPLGDLVQSGDTVLIKPNWVFHSITTSPNSENILECLITHTSLIRAVIDYAYLAVGSSGKIIIADSPIQSTEFSTLLERARIPDLVHFFQLRGVSLQISDLRKRSVQVEPDGRIRKYNQHLGDPKGYVVTKVDRESALCDLERESRQLYHSIDYDGEITQNHHIKDTHRYLISRSVLEADLIINMPKLKTHGKSGITAAMKNLVGINGDKAYLPHFRLGAPSEGGDAYQAANFWLKIKGKYHHKILQWPRAMLWFIRPLGNYLVRVSANSSPFKAQGDKSDPYLSPSGSWYGNDTVWRMVVDLNRALRYSNNYGELQVPVKRQWLSIVDGLMLGEGEGPLTPTPLSFGYVIGGFCPVRIDAVCTKLMGFDWHRIPMISQGSLFLIDSDDLNKTEIISNHSSKAMELSQLVSIHVIAPSGWQHHIELSDWSK